MSMTTAKALKREYGTGGLCVGYCAARHILRPFSELAHTAGVYGWNFDAYEISGVLICTGYRGMIGRPCRFLSEYEKKAREIYESHSDDWQEKVRALCLEWLKKEYEQ